MLGGSCPLTSPQSWTATQKQTVSERHSLRGPCRGSHLHGLLNLQMGHPHGLLHAEVWGFGKDCWG